MNPRPETASLGPAAAVPDRSWASIRRALAVCREPANLRRTCRIALVVGCVLTLINELDVFVAGKETTFTAFKVALNFCVPFVVSNLGLLAGSKLARD
jgi:hypothetical protein